MQCNACHDDVESSLTDLSTFDLTSIDFFFLIEKRGRR